MNGRRLGCILGACVIGLLLAGVTPIVAQQTPVENTTTNEVTYHHSNQTAIVTKQLHIVSDTEQTYWKYNWGFHSPTRTG